MITEIKIKKMNDIPLVNTSSELVKALRRVVGNFRVTIIAKDDKIIFNVPESVYNSNTNFFSKEGLEALTEKYYNDLERQCSK